MSSSSKKLLYPRWMLLVMPIVAAAMPFQSVRPWLVASTERLKDRTGVVANNGIHKRVTAAVVNVSTILLSSFPYTDISTKPPQSTPVNETVTSTVRPSVTSELATPGKPTITGSGTPTWTIAASATLAWPTGQSAPDTGELHKVNATANHALGHHISGKLFIVVAVIVTLVLIATFCFLVYKWQRGPLLQKIQSGRFIQSSSESIHRGDQCQPMRESRQFSFNGTRLSLTFPPPATLSRSVSASRRDSLLDSLLVSEEVIVRGPSPMLATIPLDREGAPLSSSSNHFPTLPEPIEIPSSARASSVPQAEGSPFHSRNSRMSDTTMTTTTPISPALDGLSPRPARQILPYSPLAMPPTPEVPPKSRFSWGTATQTETSTSNISPSRSTASGSPGGCQIYCIRNDHTSSLSDSAEPPRFRGVHSWINSQAKCFERQERLERAAERQAAKQRHEQHTNASDMDSDGNARISISTLGTRSCSSQPGTPVAFRHHPGSPVEFGGGSRHLRLSSEELDKQVDPGLASEWQKRLSPEVNMEKDVR